jgi:peroxiredoxin
MTKKMIAFTAMALTCLIATANAEPQTLAQKLAERSASSKADAATKAQMQKAIQELAASNIVESAIHKGDMMPDFTLPTIEKGKAFKLSEALEDGPVVLVYYRGDWCPYCNLQLAAYQRHLKDFSAANAQIVAVSPQTAANSNRAPGENPFDFTILVDTDNRLARELGIVFELPDYLQAIYKEFGIDLHVENDSDKMELPLAATYIIQKDRKVAYSYLEEDYTKRAEPSEVLAKIKELSGR